MEALRIPSLAHQGFSGASTLDRQATLDRTPASKFAHDSDLDESPVDQVLSEQKVVSTLMADNFDGDSDDSDAVFKRISWLGDDWFNGAASLKGSQQYIHKSVWIWMGIHCACLVIFTMRSCELGWGANTILPVLLAALYAIIGVGLPLLACHVLRSAPMTTMLAHREKFFRLKQYKLRCLVKVGCFLGPSCKVLSLAAPLHVLMHWFNYTDQAEGWSTGWYNPLVVSCTFCGLVGMTVFASGTVDELVLEASHVAIHGFINEIEPSLGCSGDNGHDTSSGSDADPEFFGYTAQSINWADIARQHWFLHQALVRLWDCKYAGLPWLVRVLVLFLAGICLTAFGTTHKDARMRRTLVPGGCVASLLGTALLLRLAAVTSSCMGGKPGDLSIMAATHRHMCDVGRIPSDNARVYHIFLEYVNGKPMGVQIGGILIDYEFVLSLACKTVVYVPTVLVTLGEIFHRDP